MTGGSRLATRTLPHTERRLRRQPTATWNLQDFGFYMGNPEVSGNILLRAYIATWNGTHAGTLLYVSADYDYANTGDAHLTFTTGGLPLTPGATYVAFL